MSKLSATAGFRTRLRVQMERNQWLVIQNRSLLVQIEELERERRHADSELVRWVKRVERSLAAMFRK